MKQYLKSILTITPVLIVVVAISIGSLLFGFRMHQRTQGQFLTENKATLETNWGTDISQQSPTLNSYQARRIISDNDDDNLPAETKRPSEVRISNVRTLSSKIDGELNMDYRRKGLTYFPTFISHITATYQLKNENEEPVETEFIFPLPTEESLVWNAKINVSGKEDNTQVNSQGLKWKGDIGPQEEKTVTIKYSARGLDRFSYALNKTNGPQDLVMNLTINGADQIDFPQGALSLSNIIERDEGWDLTWEFDQVLSSPSITVKMFAKKNISEQIARLFWFVPVLLTGYLLSIKGLSNLRNQKLKPFDYILLAALYTVFYPFLAYLVSVFNQLTVFTGLGISLALITPIILYFQQHLFDLKFILTKGLLLQVFFGGLFPIALLIPELTGFMAIAGLIVMLAVVVQLRVNYDASK